MKDRFASLQRISRLYDNDDEVPLSIEHQPLGSTTDISISTQSFLEQIKLEKKKVRQFNISVQNVSSLHRLLLGALKAEPDVDAVEEAIRRLDQQFPQVDKHCSLIVRTVNELRNSLHMGCRNEIELEFRRNQLMSLSEPFRTVLMKFNGDYVLYQEATRQTAVHYAKTHDLDANAWIRSIRRSSIIVAHGMEAQKDQHYSSLSRETKDRQIMRSTSAFEAVFNEIKGRHLTIEKVEKSIEELGDIFQQLQFHIMESKEPALLIEKKVEVAVDFAENTNFETSATLAKCLMLRKKKKLVSKMRVLIITLIMLLTVLLLLLLRLLLIFAFRLQA